MKLYAIIALFATFLIGIEAANFTMGICNPNHIPLYHTYVREPHSWFRVKERVVTYPEKGVINSYGKNNIITGVKVIDHKSENGGKVNLVSGGPGYTFATVVLKSDRGHGLECTVIIY